MRDGITISWDCGLSGRIRNPVRPSSGDPFEDTCSPGGTATNSCGDQYHASFGKSRQRNIRTKSAGTMEMEAGVVANKTSTTKGQLEESDCGVSRSQENNSETSLVHISYRKEDVNG